MVLSSLRWVVGGVVALGLVFGLGRCVGGREARQDAAVEVALATGQRLALLVRVNKLVADSARVAREVSERAREEAARRARVAVSGVRGVVAEVARADSVGAEGTDWRGLAVGLADSVGVLVVVVEEALAAADTASARHAAERRALLSVLDTQDSVVVAKDAVIRAMREASECRVVWRVPCPTRTQAFVVGAVTTGVVVLALSR